MTKGEMEVETKTTNKKILTVGELKNALSKFENEDEVLVSFNNTGGKCSKIEGITANSDFGNDNECAFIEVRIDK